MNGSNIHVSALQMLILATAELYSAVESGYGYSCNHVTKILSYKRANTVNKM